MYHREIEGTTYTHEFLWRAGTYSLVHAKENQSGSHYFLTNAFLVSVLAFEAFTNFLGEIVAPAAWSDERRFFSREPYKGFIGKVRKIADELNCPIAPDDPHYLTFLRAKKLRDKIAHGRVTRTSISFITHDLDPKEGLDFMRLAWDEILDIAEVENIRDHLQKLADKLRIRAKESHVEAELHLNFPAFKGSLASASGHFKSIENDLPP